MFKKREFILKKYNNYNKILFENNYYSIVIKNNKTIMYGNSKYNLLSYIYYIYGKNIFNNYRCGIVHRLDKNTSGILILSKRKSFYKIIKKQFKKRTLKKYYIVIFKTNFYIKKKLFKLKSYIRNKKNFNYRSYCSKYSVSFFKKILIFKKKKYINVFLCKLLTGRKNQIKIHINYLFKSKINKIKLHSWKIQFYFFKKFIYYSYMSNPIKNIIKNKNFKIKI
ncbi:pseudouridine synthase [Candidatus Vidania fulgoroideorum]